MESNDITPDIISSSSSPVLSSSSSSSSPSSPLDFFIQTTINPMIYTDLSDLPLSTNSVKFFDPSTVESSDQDSRWVSSEPLLIPVTILYSLILVTGIIGNVSTCIVIARNKYMRTATNYYLFSLAISDLLLLICGLPQELYLLWRRRPYIFGEFFCIIRGLSSETSSNASVLTITAFTIERYLAICYPLKAHTMSKLSRVIRLIVIIWILALLGALPMALQFGIKYEYFGQHIITESAECTVVKPLEHSFALSSLIFFVIPCFLLTALYLSIGLHLRQSEALKRSHPLYHHQQQQTNSHHHGDSKCCNSFFTKHHSNQHNSHHRSDIFKTLNNNNSTNSQTNSPNIMAKYHISLLKNGSSAMYSKFKPKIPLTESRSSSGTQHGSNASSSSRRAVIKMLVAVVVAFFVCWAPFHAQRLMATYASGTTQAEIIIYNLLTYISGVTYYLSTTINPILYSIMSIKFRQAFKETLGSCCRKTASEPGLGKFHHGLRSSSHFNSTLKSTLGPDSDIIGAVEPFSASYCRRSVLLPIDPF